MREDLDRIKRFLAFLSVQELGSRIAAALFRLGVVAAAALCVNVLFVENVREHPWLGFAAAAAGSTAFWLGLLAAVSTAVRPLSVRGAGRRVETARRDFRDDILSSLSLAPRLASTGEEGLSKPLLRALIAGTAARLARSRPGHFVSWRPSAAWFVRLGVALVPVAVLATAGPGISPAALKAVADPRVYWPLGKVVFEVFPGDAVVARGADLDVSARVRGPAAAAVALVREVEGELPVRYGMAAGEDGLFHLTIKAVESPFRYRLSSAAASSPRYGVRVVEPPTAGSFSAHYSYPTYTAMPSRRVAVTGDLEALKGTGVTLEFTSSKPLKAGKLLLGDGEYEVSPVGERRYEASFFLGGETKYRLELVDEGGFSSTDPLEYSIRYLADELPEIEITSPKGEISLGPFLQIPVRFRARDDFGISSISLVYRDHQGRERRERVLRDAGGLEVRREHLWDAGGLQAPPGSLVPVYLEAFDNDSISGPKSSLSNSFFIKVADPGEERRKTEESLDALIDRLVDLLADELDLEERYGEQTESAREDWEAHSWEETGRNESLREAVHEAARQAGRSMQALREQMSVDPSSRQEAFFQLDLMESTFREMMNFSLEPLKDVSRSVDPEKIRREDFQQKSAFMERYAREAVRATEDMLLMAEEMRREENMADMVDTGKEMLTLQEELLRGLEKLEEGDAEELNEMLEELAALEEMVRQLMEELAEQAEQLPEDFVNSDAMQNLPLPEMMEGLQKIREKLRQGDLEGAKEAARELMKNIADLLNRLQEGSDEFRRRAEEAASRLRNNTVPTMERLIREQEEVLRETTELEAEMSAGREEGAEEESSRLAAKEGELREETEGLAREAAALKGVLPFLDPELEKNLDEAAGDMHDAQEALAGTDPGGAVPSEQAALDKLRQARDGARRSLQGMQQMQSLRRGRGQAFRPEWMGERAGQSSPSRGTSPGGRLGTDVRSFRIPGKDDYFAPSLFRQEILESLKEGYPAQYERDIKEYFQRITD